MKVIQTIITKISSSNYNYYNYSITLKKITTLKILTNLNKQNFKIPSSYIKKCLL